MPRWIRDQSLTLFFTVLFLGTLIGQALVGRSVFNAEAIEHGEATVSLGRYVVSSHYGQAVLENWQSEYLQFTLLILATIWLYQRGSPESPDEPGSESEKDELLGSYARENSPALAKRPRGLLRWLYEYSLLLVLATIWVLSWLGQSFTGWTEYNDEQRAHDGETTSWTGYLGTAEFWEDTLQNWQSEFLAVASFAIFAVYLRARGSSESKVVGAPHDETGPTG
jgi:hypothetical protein